jgi:hypothetical protein
MTEAEQRMPSYAQHETVALGLLWVESGLYLLLNNPSAMARLYSSSR